ncbi:hypothetical protein [Fructilactobacillus fructivorans]|uniref:Uncharacterized protein n=1 Tax=Fructilactobacillus fructivorans TaxID=1614 RepID=A0A0C1Q2N4_9LACO|nr:hypothetical protein [Fructilactobacillus fructivorans]KID42073.1 hypothetical protein LfDm3_0478 [Fructilactobacillus fructivorans]MCT0151965.1 hypothetical protein [Fructilactobacillus fructivorans]MCT2867857.1 hypothetical protein [Fructilactobacillus fructivorans]MCT2868561.1 hypothetical protein [Fructilactobacillus fructivorans]MCT2873561.1 hypothetical protein [Fructilactobacillus fructivorans]
MKTKAYETYNLVEYDKDLPYEIGDLVEVTFVNPTGMGDNQDDWLKVVRHDVGESTSIHDEFRFDSKCIKAVKKAK